LSDSPVLIVFCREPVAGQTKTRLLSHIGACDAAALAGAFIVDTLAKARALHPSRLVIAGTSDTPIADSSYFRKLAQRFHADLIDQGQGSLGARMEHALEPFLSGRGALLIGTDLPALPLIALQHLMALLAKRRLVIGPSLDGGYYAIGARGALPPIFEGIRWGSSRVMEQTLLRARAAGRAVALGPVWFDVDRWGELMLLARFLQRIERRGTELHPCPETARVLRRLGLLSRRR
jgi:rSAM/selenodomain-associated transferase 1